MKRYIGNKEKLLGEIEQFIVEKDPNIQSIFDIFAGTGSVSNYFRSKYEVSANDIMEFSRVILKAKLSFENAPEFKKFIEIYKVDPVIYLNNLPTKKNKKCIVWNHFSPKGGRMYFTEENALKIDAARLKIDQLLSENSISKDEWYYLLACIISAANSKGNTTGTFGAFLKSFSPSSIKPIVFSHIELTIGKKGDVYSSDAKKIIKDIKTDLLYMDPPYTAIDYSQAYHVLESIALYDSFEYKGITGRRVENNKVSNFTKEKLAEDEFKYIINNAKNVKNILISYSTHGIVDYKKIENMLRENYNDVFTKKITYQKYRNVYENEKGDLYELLIMGRGRK